MNEEDLTALFATALLIGLSSNGHLLTANVDSISIGKMIGERAEGIAQGFLDQTEGKHRNEGV